jgi:parvulin-like peptidyl-prolyl isomerase
MELEHKRIYRIAVAAFAAAMMAGATVCAFGQEKPAASAPQTGPAQAAAADATADTKVVLRVGKEEVTKSDMDTVISTLSPQSQEAISKEGRRAVGDQFAVMLVLDQQAEKDNLDSSPEVRQRLELEKRQLLAQVEYQKLANQIQVTPDEVSQYFNAHKDVFDQVKLYEAIVRKKAADAKAGDPGLPADQALAKINAIRAALVSGADINKVKTQFSVPNVVVVDSEPRTVRRGQLLPDLDKEAFSMKDGAVSQPYQTPQAIVLFQVIGHEPAELKDNSSQIENDLRREKLDAEIADLRKSANIWMDDDYFKAASAPAEEPAAKEPETAKPAAPAPRKP